MEVSTALLLRTPLFRGIPQEALPALLEGLGARKRRCGRGPPDSETPHNNPALGSAWRSPPQSVCSIC